MLSALLPSLFHRRLVLLAGLTIGAFALPTVQLVRLAALGHDEARAQAESRLELTRPLPTTRGRILDRKGRVLAASRPSYDIAVDYPVLTGQWAFTQAARRARQLAGPTWNQMPARERERMIQDLEPEFRAQLDDAWSTFAQISGLTRAELDERQSGIVQRVVRVGAALRAREQRRREEAIARGEEVPRDPPRLIVREESQPHVLLHNVDDRTAFAFLQLVDRGAGGAGGSGPAGSFIPGLRVLDTAGREYPFEHVDVAIDRSSFPGPLKSEQPLAIGVQGVATHVLGLMRSQFTEEDEQGRDAERARRAITGSDAGAYRPGDSAGRAGIERAAEFDLRGLRGSITQRLDSPGETRVEPRAGKDVPLTLDIMLQARVQALLDPRAGLTTVQPWHGNHTVAIGQPLAGAAVVIEVNSGDILALVSSPSYTREQLREGDEAVLEDPVSAALVNRAIAKAYPPGSIVKPLIYAGAVSSGIIPRDFKVGCTGHFLPNNPRTLQCWIFKQFQTTHADTIGHDLDAAEALMVSCNIYFYTLGKMLGPRGIIDLYGRFGVGPGEDNLGLGEQFAGIAGQPRDPAQTTSSEAVLMGMGQGPVAWTPLHAADAFATLARSGLRQPPRLRSDVRPPTTDLKLDSGAVAIALEGLRKAVRDERGTAHHVSIDDGSGNTVREPTINAPRVEVWGKSGTADAPAVLSEGEPGQRTILRDGDHSWLVCLVGPQGGAPKYAIAVVIDYGGSGGKVSGPVANQIIHALIAEGYL
jgi:penicillin-binding protein 2